MEYFPYQVAIWLLKLKAKPVLGDISSIMELENFKDLNSHSIHIRGKFSVVQIKKSCNRRLWSWKKNMELGRWTYRRRFMGETRKCTFNFHFNNLVRVQFSPWYPMNEDLVVLGTKLLRGFSQSGLLTRVLIVTWYKLSECVTIIMFNLGKHKTGTGKRSTKVSFLSMT